MPLPKQTNKGTEKNIAGPLNDDSEGASVDNAGGLLQRLMTHTLLPTQQQRVHPTKTKPMTGYQKNIDPNKVMFLNALKGTISGGLLQTDSQ